MFHGNAFQIHVATQLSFLVNLALNLHAVLSANAVKSFSPKILPQIKKALFIRLPRPTDGPSLHILAHGS